MILRDSALVRGVEWAVAVWAAMFAATAVAVGDSINSRQWQYLLSIPGHEWFWGGLFGGAAVLLTFGLWRGNYKANAVALFMIGLGCTMIAAFYTVAPILDHGLITLGMFPWMLAAGVTLLAGVINAKPGEWF